MKYSMEHSASPNLFRMLCELEGTSAFRVNITISRPMANAKERFFYEGPRGLANSPSSRTWASFSFAVAVLDVSQRLP